MRRELGPKQRAKRGNERFAEVKPRAEPGSDVAPEDAGRDTSDEEAGVIGILRKADESGRPPLSDNGHDQERDRKYRAPPER